MTSAGLCSITTWVVTWCAEKTLKPLDGFVNVYALNISLESGLFDSWCEAEVAGLTVTELVGHRGLHEPYVAVW